jgi:hypothetical protein
VSFLRRFGILLMLLTVLLATGAAQNGVPSGSPANGSQSQENTSGQEQRVFGVVPQFSVTNDASPPPLTPGQKFKLFGRTSFDPFNFAAAGLQAGLSQATDEFPQYDQGAAGYAKRYAASFADQVSSNFFANYVYSALLKEDPRYFRLGKGTVRRRMVYALEQEFVVHKDSGGKTFGFENILGAFTSGTLSNAYYPSNDRGLGLTVSRSVISILYGSAGGLFSEFSPDLQRLLFHCKEKQEAVAGISDH